MKKYFAIEQNNDKLSLFIVDKGQPTVVEYSNVKDYDIIKPEHTQVTVTEFLKRCTNEGLLLPGYND